MSKIQKCYDKFEDRRQTPGDFTTEVKIEKGYTPSPAPEKVHLLV